MKEEDIPRWYVIRTHPRQEERAASNLAAWQLETLSPKLKHLYRNQFTGHPTYVTKPLFPRYLFARFIASSLLHKVWFTRGVQSVVNFGGMPASVDDELIDFIKSRVREDGFIKIGEDLKAGDKVVIKDSTFENLVGIFERDVKDTNRVRILLEAVNYHFHVEVNKGQVRKVV